MVSVGGGGGGATVSSVGIVGGAAAAAAVVPAAAVPILRIPVDEVGVGEHGELLLEGGAALLGRHVLGDLVQVRDVLRHVDAVTSPAVVHHFRKGDALFPSLAA